MSELCPGSDHEHSHTDSADMTEVAASSRSLTLCWTE